LINNVVLLKSGKVAYGKKEKLSWLVCVLNYAFSEWKGKEDLELMNILTVTVQQMSGMVAKVWDPDMPGTYNDYKCVPVIQHKLTKELRLKIKK